MLFQVGYLKGVMNKKMNVGQGQDINSKVFKKLDDLEIKKMEKRIEKSYPEIVRRAFPKDKILNAGEAVTHLRKVTSLEEGVIRNCLADLIGKKEIISSRDTKGRLHLAKLKKLY